MVIPIQNIYYMLVYAWDVLDEAEGLNVQTEDCTQLVDLFASVLHTGTEAALRRGLDRGYLPNRESISGIRGKIDISASIKTCSFMNGRAVCEFDELTHDVQHNRILKSTIRRLLQTPGLDVELSDKLAETNYRLHQVAEIELNERAFRSLQLHRNNRHYKLLMEVCRLIHRANMIYEDAGETEFRDFVRDERRMRRLFEKFIRNFYKHEQHEFRVKASRMHWSQAKATEHDLSLLPTMLTDITLLSDERVILVETKFTDKVVKEYHGKPRIRSGHLYQLYTYLSNVAGRASLTGRELSGILLYPSAERNLDLQYELNGYRVRVYTINLNNPWRDIKKNLLGLLNSRCLAVEES